MSSLYIYILIYLWLNLGFGGAIDFCKQSGNNWINFCIGFAISLIVLPFMLPSFIFMILFRLTRRRYQLWRKHK